MDYEKKYNEALNWMRELYPGLHGATKEDAEHYFPELRESEDEKMMNQLHSWMMEFGGAEEYAERVFQWLKGLLEKQKEQKPAKWSEKHIADIFEKVGLAKIAREQGNDALTNAIQSAMIELSKVGNAEWSDKDMGFLYEVMTMVQSRGGWVRSDDAIENVKSWLNALPERFNLQPKQEWNEEEKNGMDLDIIMAIRAYYKYKREDLVKYFKILRPQNHWKPNEYLFSLVKKVANGEMLTRMEQMSMETLYDNLQKL